MVQVLELTDKNTKMITIIKFKKREEQVNKIDKRRISSDI